MAKAKITIHMEKPAQWVSKLSRLYFADIFARKTEGIPARAMAQALDEVEEILPNLEVKMIEFLAEWLVTLLSPAAQVLKARAPHLAFIGELYLGLKVTASLGREESYTRIIDGQVRCITQEKLPKYVQVVWNVQFLTVFVPAWMIPPQCITASVENASKMQHILMKLESGRYANMVRRLEGALGAGTKQSTGRLPTYAWPEVGHQRRCVTQEQLPIPAVERLAETGLLAVDTWNSKCEVVNFKATIEIPAGTCSRKKATIRELDMLQEYDLKRSSVAINRKATQWSHNSMWNKKHIEPIQGYTRKQLWKDAEILH